MVSYYSHVYYHYYHADFSIIATCVVPELLLTDGKYSIRKRAVENDVLTPVEGMTISFVCPFGLKLVGPDSATCGENGEWEPNLKGLMCTLATG